MYIFSGHKQLNVVKMNTDKLVKLGLIKLEKQKAAVTLYNNPTSSL